MNKQNHSACPIDLVVQAIGNKWAIPILRDLFCGPKRPSALLRSLDGISPKTLTDRLREMEATGLVSRSVQAQIPPFVEYSLTPMGLELRELLLTMKALGQKWGGTSCGGECSVTKAFICQNCFSANFDNP